MHQFSIPIEDIMDLPPIADEINLIGLCENAVQNKFQQTEQQSLDIFIQFNQKKELITINVNKETIVGELKEIVIQKLQDSLIFTNAFDLYYKCEQMMEDSRLEHYQLQNNALIEVIFNQAAQLMKSSKTVNLKQDITKDDIKLNYQDQLPILNQHLSYDGILNESKIEDKKIFSPDKCTGTKVLNLILYNHIQNKKFYVQVEPMKCVGDLEREFEIILNTEKLSFQFNQMYLSPIRSFADQGIKNNDILTISINQQGGCFPFYAPITLADKSQKPISQIIKGDEILCYDYKYREFRSGIVQGTTKTKHKTQLIRIQTQTMVIDCTADHPLYTQSGWKAFEPHPDFQINNLTLEDKLLNQDNIFINIISIQKLNQFDYVYNLNLKYPNNYLVFGFLAHNMNIINVEINGKKQQFEYFPEMPIQQIKVLIFKKRGIPIEHQKLYYWDQLMDDEKIVEDYLKQDQKIMQITLSLEIDEKQQQQQKQFVISNSNFYKLLLNNDIKLQYLKKIVRYFENQELILIDGQQYTSEFDQIKIDKLPKIQQILLLSREEGGLSIGFYAEINSIGLTELSELQQHLQSLQLNFNVEEFFQTIIKQINEDQQKAGIYQKYKLHHLIALKLWTTNLIYRQLNNDLRINSYQKWVKYLKCLIDGLKYSEYYRGRGYIGVKNFQDTTIYEIDKTIQWRDIQAISLKKEVAEKFSNNKGMIFEIEMISSKDISQISVYPNEQEVLMFPFSNYKILNVIKNNNQPIVVQMREIPMSRNLKNILWVDDNPENNYKFARKLETQDDQLSIIFCTSTNDAIQIINSHKWMLFSQKSQFRIISDMVRVEDMTINYTAGTELLKRLHLELNFNGEVLIFTQDEKLALKSLQQTNYHNYTVTKYVDVLEKFIRFE